jgi:hypothetical protein
MNREVLFRVLQVAVVAPWLYHISQKSDTSPYFSIGLKLVAGSIIALNAKPLLNDWKNAQALITQLQNQVDETKPPTIIEGEVETV